MLYHLIHWKFGFGGRGYTGHEFFNGIDIDCTMEALKWDYTIGIERILLGPSPQIFVPKDAPGTSTFNLFFDNNKTERNKLLQIIQRFNEDEGTG